MNAVDTLTNARAAVHAALARDGIAAPSGWRVIITDSESPTGVAPVCTEGRSNALHVIDDYPGGPERDEDGVYDCCPWPQFDTYSVDTAAYLVALLNVDADTPLHAAARQAARNEAADWLASHPISSGNTGWARGRNDAIAWVIGILRNPDPRKPGPDEAQAEFFQVGHTYTEPDGITDWKFRVDSITTHPEDGERTAIGWRHFRGEWDVYAYGEDDWEIHQAVGYIDVTEAGDA